MIVVNKTEEVSGGIDGKKFIKRVFIEEVKKIWPFTQYHAFMRTSAHFDTEMVFIDRDCEEYKEDAEKLWITPMEYKILTVHAKWSDSNWIDVHQLNRPPQRETITDYRN